MRTIKRCSDALNKVKLDTIRVMASAYAKEKRYWLALFQQQDNMGRIKKHREVRDEFVAANYQSPYGLQARMWKLALVDAAETMDKYWQSIFDKVKSSVFRFHHRLETKQLGTVSGRILDTRISHSTGLGQSESEYQKIGNCYI